jgi:hypothetical protein
MTVSEAPANRHVGSRSGWCYRHDGRFTGGETNLYNVTVKKTGFQILVSTFEKTNRNGFFTNF